MRKILFALAILWAAPGNAAVTYTATVLQTQAGLAMQAFGLNNHGDVVGGAGDGDAYQAYLRTAAGAYQALGGFGGTRSTATAISQTGIIAGQARTGSTGLTSVPFVRFGDGMLTPIALPSGGDTAVANGVNDAGTVVGRFNIRDSRNRAINQGFRWSLAHGFEVLASAAGGNSVSIQGLNSSGVAVGTSFGSDVSPFRWEADGSVTPLEKLSGVPTDIFNGGYANAISDSGLTAGGLDATGIGGDGGFVDTNLLAIWGSDARLLRTAAIADGFAGNLTAINGFGDAVGAVWRSVFDPLTQTFTDEGHVVLWLAGEDPVDLDTLLADKSLHLQGAFGINDKRQIIAFGYRDGIRFDVLLTPNAGGVPEPASWAMMIAGFALAGAAARRRFADAAGLRSVRG